MRCVNDHLECIGIQDMQFFLLDLHNAIFLELGESATDSF